MSKIKKTKVINASKTYSSLGGLNYQNCILITAKFYTTIKSTKYSSWVVQICIHKTTFKKLLTAVSQQSFD